MLLGYTTWGMPNLPIEVTLEHLSRLGFDGVELTVCPGFSTELSKLDRPERLRINRLLDQYHLGMPSIAVHRDLVVEDPQEWAANLQYLQGSIDLATDLAGPFGIPVINNLVGGKSGEFSLVRSRLIERLRQVLAYAEPRGVVIAIEPHVYTVLESLVDTTELLDEIGSPFLKVQFDISHFDVLGFTIEESVAALGPVAVHTHLKDQRGRVPDFEFMIPGEGDFNYVKYLQEMLKTPYKGFITGEVSVMVQRRPGYDPLAAAAMTYDTLSRAFEQAGIQRPVRT